MELLAKYADPKNAFDRLIVAATPPGSFCHTEIRFSDGRCFSSRAPAGVSFLPAIDTSDATKWAVIPLPWPETPEVLAWCGSVVGCKYDWLAAFNAALHLGMREHNRWFCSETSCEIISRAGGPTWTELLPPNKLVRILATHLGQCERLGIYREPLCAESPPDYETVCQCLGELFQQESTVKVVASTGPMPEGIFGDANGLVARLTVLLDRFEAAGGLKVDVPPLQIPAQTWDEGAFKRQQESGTIPSGQLNGFVMNIPALSVFVPTPPK